MKNDILIPAIAWIVLTAACLVLIIAGLKTALRRAGWEKNVSRKILISTIIFMSVWVALLLILSSKGFFSDFGLLPPRPALAIFIPLPVILIIAFSKQGTQLLQVIPQQWIVWLQSFRIAVELLLLLAFTKGMLPVQMTFEGINFDILSGVLALPVGYILAQKKTYAKKMAIAFNIIGLLLLLNILVIAVLSMPIPIRYFMNEPANTLVAEFPFILLPGVLVPIAYGFHIFSLRQLLTGEKKAGYNLGTYS
jgi:uncharacterized membrane protein